MPPTAGAATCSPTGRAAGRAPPSRSASRAPRSPAGSPAARPPPAATASPTTAGESSRTGSTAASGPRWSDRRCRCRPRCRPGSTKATVRGDMGVAVHVPGHCLFGRISGGAHSVWHVPRVLAQPGELGCGAGHAARGEGTRPPHRSRRSGRGPRLGRWVVLGRRGGRRGLGLGRGPAPEQPADALENPGHRPREDAGLALDDVTSHAPMIPRPPQVGETSGNRAGCPA